MSSYQTPISPLLPEENIPCFSHTLIRSSLFDVRQDVHLWTTVWKDEAQEEWNFIRNLWPTPQELAEGCSHLHQTRAMRYFHTQKGQIPHYFNVSAAHSGLYSTVLLVTDMLCVFKILRATTAAPLGWVHPAPPFWASVRGVGRCGPLHFNPIALISRPKRCIAQWKHLLKRGAYSHSAGIL